MAKRSLIQMATGWCSRIRRGDKDLRLNFMVLPSQTMTTNLGYIWRRALTELWRCQLIFNLIKQGN